MQSRTAPEVHALSAIPSLDTIGIPTTTPASSASTYSIDWRSINGGGAVNAASPSCQMGSSIGQAVAGAAASPSYQMGIGIWYGAAGGGCTCDCHGDFGAPCDGSTNILDTSDVNCSGSP